MMRFYKKIPAGGVGGPQRRWRRRSRPTRYPKQPQNVAKSFLFTQPAALPRPSARQFGAPADRIFCFKPPLSPEAEGVESRKFGNKKREKRSSQNVSLSIFTLPLPLFRGQNGCHRGQNGVSRDNDTLISSCWQLRPQNRRRASPGLRPSQNART